MNRKVRKIILMFCAMLVMVMPVYVAKAAENQTAIIESGSYDNISWSIDEEGVLSLNGTGVLSAIPDISQWAIRKVVIGEGITEIDCLSFEERSDIVTVTIPASVNRIGWDAFNGCSHLETIEVDPDSNTFCSKEGILFSKDGTKLIVYPRGKEDTSYVIPETVTAIGALAFYGCDNLINVVVPGNVKRVDQEAFDLCHNLETVYFEEGVTSLRNYLFNWCTSLKEIVIPSSVENIGTEIVSYEWDGKMHVYAGSTAEQYAKEHGYHYDTIIDSGYFENLTWILNEKGEMTVWGQGKLRILPIPDKGPVEKVIVSEGITEIGSGAFEWNVSAKEIVLPEGLTTISAAAFYDCRELVSVNIPDTVTFIGDLAFSECDGLREIVLPAGLKTLYPRAFQECDNITGFSIAPESEYYCCEDGIVFSKDKTVLYIYPGGKTDIEYRIPDCVTIIYPNAFSGNGYLTQVEISQYVDFVGGGAFARCENLKTLVVDERNCTYSSEDGIILSIDKKRLIAYPSGKPDTHFVIPENVTVIEGFSFIACDNLVSLVVPGNVKSVGQEAFDLCQRLETVYFEEGVTDLNNYLFNWCPVLKEVIIPASVTKIGTEIVGIGYPFEGMLRVYDGSYAQQYAMENNYSYSVIADSGRSGETSWILDDNGVLTFFGTGIAKVPEEIKEQVTGAVLCERIRGLAYEAFNSCTNMSYAYIPESVTIIENDAFTHCDSLTHINVNENNAVFCDVDGVVYTKDMRKLVVYPNGKVSDPYVVPNGVTTIGFASFSGSGQLKGITFPDSLTSIEGWAFCDCSSLTEIIIPDSVSEVKDGIFYGCDNLQTVILPAGLTAIEYSTFAMCRSLEHVAIPQTVESIGKYAFARCDSMRDFYLPESITEIDEYMLGEDIHGERVCETVIHGKAGSAAEEYALKRGYRFVAYIYSDAKLYGYSFSLEEGIVALNCYVQLPAGFEGRNLSMKVNCGGKESKLTEYSRVDADEMCLYRFVCPLNAKQMTDTITMQMIIDDTSDAVFETSFRQYADQILKNEYNDPQYARSQSLVKALLNYGGYAQEYFGYNLNDKANAGIFDNDEDPVQRGNSAISFETEQNSFVQKGNSAIEYLGMSLVCAEQLEAKAYFNLNGVTDYQVLYDGYALNNTYIEKNGDIVCVREMLYPFTEMDKEYELTVVDTTKDEKIIVRISVPLYISSCINAEDEKLQALGRAIYYLSREADQYLKELDTDDTVYARMEIDANGDRRIYVEGDEDISYSGLVARLRADGTIPVDADVDSKFVYRFRTSNREEWKEIEGTSYVDESIFYPNAGVLQYDYAREQKCIKEQVWNQLMDLEGMYSELAEELRNTYMDYRFLDNADICIINRKLKVSLSNEWNINRAVLKGTYTVRINGMKYMNAAGEIVFVPETQCSFEVELATADYDEKEALFVVYYGAYNCINGFEPCDFICCEEDAICFAYEGHEPKTVYLLRRDMFGQKYCDEASTLRIRTEGAGSDSLTVYTNLSEEEYQTDNEGYSSAKLVNSLYDGDSGRFHMFGYLDRRSVNDKLQDATEYQLRVDWMIYDIASNIEYYSASVKDTVSKYDAGHAYITNINTYDESKALEKVWENLAISNPIIQTVLGDFVAEPGQVIDLNSLVNAGTEEVEWEISDITGDTRIDNSYLIIGENENAEIINLHVRRNGPSNSTAIAVGIRRVKAIDASINLLSGNEYESGSMYQLNAYVSGTFLNGESRNVQYEITDGNAKQKGTLYGDKLMLTESMKPGDTIIITATAYGGVQEIIELTKEKADSTLLYVKSLEWKRYDNTPQIVIGDAYTEFVRSLRESGMIMDENEVAHRYSVSYRSDDVESVVEISDPQSYGCSRWNEKEINISPIFSTLPWSEKAREIFITWSVYNVYDGRVYYTENVVGTVTGN